MTDVMAKSWQIRPAPAPSQYWREHLSEKPMYVDDPSDLLAKRSGTA
jgi:hypothetical protein